MQKNTAPTSEAQLLERAANVAGLNIEQLANLCAIQLPEQGLKFEKGWAGQLLEYYLGTDAGCAAKPDFVALNIELKTIPINQQAKPIQTTYVTKTPLLNLAGLTWETSEVRHKLQRVLWIPIEGETSIPLPQRRIGMPVLWSPSEQDELILQQDWQELMDMVALGQLEQITARHGKYLQIRPKAGDAKDLCWGINELGEKILTLPRGFYLRTCFTKKIINSA